MTVYDVQYLEPIFDFKNRKFGLVSFKEIIALSDNFIYRTFESPKLDLYNLSHGPFFGTATSCTILAEPHVQIFGTDFRIGKSENLD